MLDALFEDYAPPRVVSLGRSIFDPVWREKEHAGRHCELLHVIRGNVRLEMRCGTIDGAVGDTILTPTGMPHRDVFPPGSKFEVYLVHFDWDAEAELFKRFTPMKLAQVPASAKAAIGADFRQLHQDFRRGGPLARQLTDLRLHQILLTLCREACAPQAPPPDRAHRIMQAAKQIILERYHEPLSLDDISDAVNVSPYYLSHVFSAESGFTLSTFLTNVRMEKASAMLTSGSRITGVARAVGYRDPQYFSRVFRAHFGVAPSRFRG